MPNWGEVLEEIAQEQKKAGQYLDSVRRGYLKKFHNKTKRNVIAYYSGWQSSPGIAGIEIRDEDRDGFMRALHGLDYKAGLDLILHTPGGSVAAAHRIISYIQDMFGGDIRAFIPHTAMSAGTIMALSCRVIFMGKHSSIGPIDPQLHGASATGILLELEKAYEEILENQNRAIIWAPILNKYTPGLITQCENAISWSKEFSKEQLKRNMFKGDADREDRVNKIITALTDNEKVKNHERQIGYDEAKEMGLKIRMLEDDQDIQDLVLTIHHCFVHAFSTTGAFKIIENHEGKAFIKIQSGIG